MTSIIIREQGGGTIRIVDASPAAVAAANRAEAAAAAAEAVGATNDTIIAGRINTPGSATRVALDGSIVASVDTADGVAKRSAANADHAAAFARLASKFVSGRGGLYLYRSGNDYTFLVGLGGARYAAFYLPRLAQSYLGVTYTLNNLYSCAIQAAMISEDDNAATFAGSGTWTNQPTSLVNSPGYKAKPLTVSTTSGSGTITVTSGTIVAGDVGRRVYLPGAGAAGATLESTIASVNTGANTFVIGTPPSATLTGVAGQLFPSYRYNATAGATATYVSPAGVTALALGILIHTNGGLGKVTIDGDATLANLLPTAQQVVTSGAYPNTILVANGGTLNPTDRVIDFYATSIYYDQKRAIADGLTAGSHTVVVTGTGYQRTAATGARLYVDRFAYATASTAPDTAGAEMFTTFDLAPGFASAWEYAIECRPAGGNWMFIGQTAHQLEEQTSFSISINDAAPATPTDLTATSARSIEIVRESKLFHSDIGAALTDTPIATARVVYRADRNGLSVSPTITWARDMEVRTAYAMMPLAGPDSTPAKIDRAALEATPSVLTLSSDGTRKGTSRSAFAWAWDSTGKVGAGMYIPDHYGFTDGYRSTIQGAQVEDRSATPHTTKLYFPWEGPNVTHTWKAGEVKSWTSRYFLAYFADADAALANA